MRRSSMAAVATVVALALGFGVPACLPMPTDDFTAQYRRSTSADRQHVGRFGCIPHSGPWTSARPHHGFSGGMEEWDPAFVNALALTHQVVIFDNAGIGGTSMPAGTFTISSMADQTDALISTLGLHRPSVLGWSMGGMIAQALVVRHRQDVSHLILAATSPGNGSAVQPSAVVLTDLQNAATRTRVPSFPCFSRRINRHSFRAMSAAISEFPSISMADASVVAAAFNAVEDWFAGIDPSGPASATVHIKTLVATGTDDEILPPANSQELAQLIRHSQLVLYPDARPHVLVPVESQFEAQIATFLK